MARVRSMGGRMSGWIGDDTKHFVAASAGIGSAEAIVGYLKTTFPTALGQVGDEILQAIAGVALVKFGPRAGPRLGQLVRAYGTGILYHLAGRLIKENVTDRYFHGSPPYSINYARPLSGSPSIANIQAAPSGPSTLRALAESQARGTVQNENILSVLG